MLLLPYPTTYLLFLSHITHFPLCPDSPLLKFVVDPSGYCLEYARQEPAASVETNLSDSWLED
jgi:hypothetical protein